MPPRFIETELPGVLLVEPAVHRDHRGFFVETWHAAHYREAGIPDRFVQDNHSGSVRGTLRGLHANARSPQGKLVRCVEGEIFDVAVDVRRGSPTFAKWVGFRLTAGSFHQLWIPEGFAHGFLVLSETAQVEYKVTAFYDPGGDLYIAWDDPEIGVAWPLDGEPLLSDRDRRAQPLSAQIDALPVYEGRDS